MPPHNLVTGAQTLTFTDRPQLRIDPTQLISTGAIANVFGAQSTASRLPAPIDRCSSKDWFNVDRNAAIGFPLFEAPNLKFEGGYAQASFVLTGETHHYNPSAAAYYGVVPEHPFSLAGGGRVPGRLPAAQHH